MKKISYLIQIYEAMKFVEDTYKSPVVFYEIHDIDEKPLSLYCILKNRKYVRVNLLNNTVTTIMDGVEF